MRRVRQIFLLLGAIAGAALLFFLAPQWLAVRSTVADIGTPAGFENVSTAWDVGLDGPEQELILRPLPTADGTSPTNSVEMLRGALRQLGFDGAVELSRERSDSLDADLVRLSERPDGEVRAVVTVADTDGAALAIFPALGVLGVGLMWVATFLLGPDPGPRRRTVAAGESDRDSEPDDSTTTGRNATASATPPTRPPEG